MPKPSSSQLIRIDLYDEIPSIGSGNRLVRVLSIGPKWVRLQAVGRKRAARIRRAVWNSIAPR